MVVAAKQRHQVVRRIQIIENNACQLIANKFQGLSGFRNTRSVGREGYAGCVRIASPRRALEPRVATTAMRDALTQMHQK
jgi:hypothetical protein